MRMLDKVRLRLRSLFRRPDVEFELETELSFPPGSAHRREHFIRYAARGGPPGRSSA